MKLAAVLISFKLLILIMVFTISQQSLVWTLLVLISSHSVIGWETMKDLDLVGFLRCRLSAKSRSEQPRCKELFVSDNESIVCSPGWKGIRCDEAVCAQGCRNGTCAQPGGCDCIDGYEGVLCDKCKVLPECKHGTCNKPWECNCESDWAGSFCDIDLNYCGHHSPCVHGECINKHDKDYECVCDSEFKGTNCDTPIDCSDSPCLNNGTCVQANSTSNYSCDCPIEFGGYKCQFERDFHKRRCLWVGLNEFDPLTDCRNFRGLRTTLTDKLEIKRIDDECLDLAERGCILAVNSYDCLKGVKQVLASGLDTACPDNKWSGLCCKSCKKGLRDAFLFRKCPSSSSDYLDIEEKARLDCCRTMIPGPVDRIRGTASPDLMTSDEIDQILRVNKMEKPLPKASEASPSPYLHLPQIL